MSAQRLSKLQKKVLLTLREAPNNQISRSKLAFEVFGWNDYNRYTADSSSAELDTRKTWVHKGDGTISFEGKGIPPNYQSKQASLTRCLKSMRKKGLVRLFGSYDSEDIEDRGREDFNAGESLTKGLEKYKDKYKKEVESGTTRLSWEKWFEKPHPSMVFGIHTGGYTKHKTIWLSNYGRRYNYNIKHIHITQDGLKTSLDILKAKYGKRTLRLNINEHIKSETRKGGDKE